jgi:hypothetical protein
MVDFKGTHFLQSVILYAVFFYVRYSVSYRDLQEIVAEHAGREVNSSAPVIDSRSVKAPVAGNRGFDANKKIVGRKRHIAVATDA